MANHLYRDNGIFVRYIIPAFLALYAGLGTSDCYAKEHSVKPSVSNAKKALKPKIKAPETKDLEKIVSNEPSKEQEKLDFLNDYTREEYLKNKDITMLALTLYGEAAGQPYEFKRGVANVILNRAEQKGKSAEETVLNPWQFSCYNRNDPNRRKIREISKKTFEDYFNEAEKLVEERKENKSEAIKFKDVTHYYNARQERKDLMWSKGKAPTAIIPCSNGTKGYFYKNIKY